MYEILKDIYTWSIYSEEKRINFNGYFIYSRNSILPNIVIDPPFLNNTDLEQIESLGSVQHILITNRNHIDYFEYPCFKYN